MDDLSRIAERTISRRGFLARLGAAVVGVAGGAAFLGPGADTADAHHICGHTGSTGGCPHPTGTPRIDAAGYPLRAADGKRIDDLGRPIDGRGRPVDENGRLLRGPGGRPLASAPRSRTCVDAVPERYGITAHQDGSWYRCCGGRVRKLMDCCAHHPRRINGGGSVTGYCRAGRRVFCIQYYQTGIKC